MLANGYGRIVNVASVAGKEGNPNASAYSASKAGVIGFTKSLGKELATRGVIANAVTPATFDSPILEQLPQSQVDYMRSKIPMGRLGEVRETAAMVCFMASEECSFTTGADLRHVRGAARRSETPTVTAAAEDGEEGCGDCRSSTPTSICGT